MAVHENKIDEGIAAAQAVLDEPSAPKQAIDFAAFGAGLAMPVAGRGRSFEPYATRCRAEQKATDGMIRVMVRYCDVLALTYTGQFDLADERAADYAEFSSSGQFLGWAIAKITAGLVATHRGNFPDAIASFEQALAALAAEEPLPWQLPGCLLLARAYAALGNTGQAERVLADARKHAGRFMALHEPQRLIAKSWLAAAIGGERLCDRFRPSRSRCRSSGRSVRRGSRGTAPRRPVRRPYASPAGWGSWRSASMGRWWVFTPARRARWPPPTPRPWT